ncbi:MAG: bifunctional 5,10-methylenetetrahydrofolate dehydrogenase/5,10-methenyltetrahydrofolate cyclohydrolase [Patescibacteria group bacterium]
MTQIVDGNKIAEQILNRVTKKVAQLKLKKNTPKLGVILVGNDQASLTYVEKKSQACQRVGIDFVLEKFSANISTLDLVAKIKNFQKKNKLSGLIIQLPLPKKINKAEVLNAIKPEIDVDCLTEANLGKLVSGTFDFVPPTPDAILEILKVYKIDLAGKNVVLVGAGELIGRPLANILIHQKATVMVTRQSTQELTKILKLADIVITGVGKPNLITGKMLKGGCVVIDAGISFVGKKICGDIEFNSVAKVASLVTPTPGGVGPITVAKLIENTVKTVSNK